MNNEQRVAILATHPLFEGIPESDLDIFAQKATEVIFLPKQVIIHQDQPNDVLYCVYRGLIRVYILHHEGKIIPIRTKGSLYVLGELNLFEEESTATVEAMQETHTFSWPISQYRDWLIQYPRLSMNLLKIQTEKLSAANKQMHAVVSLELKERTIEVLHILAPYFPGHEITMSQEELSDVIGASRARVTEVLDQLSVEKRISLSRRSIRLL